MKRWAIFGIRFYQLLSPFRHQLMRSFFGFSATCKQTPSCSEYTISQIQKHGTITGLRKGFWRVLHCHSISRNK